MDKNYILHKYLNGNASPEELQLLKESPEYAGYFKIAAASENLDTPVFNKEGNFEHLTAKIDQSSKVRKISFVKSFVRIAAMVTILLGGYYFFFSGNTTVKTDVAHKESFSLPDKSEVVLNAQSEIFYDQKNWEKKRSLNLKGEAYFKVEKGEKFSVITPQGTVSVLGTQFNVFARDSTFVVKCFEGLVRVAFNDTLVNVPFGNVLEIRNNELIMKTELHQDSPNWVLNESRFQNASLATVLAELKRQYPVNITAPNVGDKKFTGAFTHTDLKVALRSICDPLKLDFTINGDEINLYAKQGK